MKPSHFVSGGVGAGLLALIVAIGGGFHRAPAPVNGPSGPTGSVATPPPAASAGFSVTTNAAGKHVYHALDKMHVRPAGKFDLAGLPEPQVGDVIIPFEYEDGSFETGRCHGPNSNTGDNYIGSFVGIPHNSAKSGQVSLSWTATVDALGIVGGHADPGKNGGDVSPGCFQRPYAGKNPSGAGTPAKTSGPAGAPANATEGTLYTTPGGTCYVSNGAGAWTMVPCKAPGA